VHPRTFLAILALVPAAMSGAQSTTTLRNADWAVYGGSDDHTHYTTLGQITPANVRRLKVAWTFDTHDAFAGSEMQSNPVVVDGVLYATTPKLQVFALDAASGKQLWRFWTVPGEPAKGFENKAMEMAIPTTARRPRRAFGIAAWWSPATG